MSILSDKKDQSWWSMSTTENHSSLHFLIGYSILVYAPSSPRILSSSTWIAGREKRKFRVRDFIFQVMTLKMHISLVLTSYLTQT